MRQLRLLLTLTCILLYCTYISAHSFADNSNIISRQSELLESYIEKYKAQISETSRKYGVRNELIIKTATQKLKDLELRIEALSQNETSESYAQSEMSQVITELKAVHSGVTKYLEAVEKSWEKSIQEKKSQYNEVSQNIIVRVERLTNSVSSSLVKKDSLTNDEKKIISSLLRLRKNNSKLKNFYIRDFLSTNEVEEEFKNIIREIRLELNTIKELLA